MNRLVFDIETKNTFDEVQSSDPAALDVSLVGIYDEATDFYQTYLEEEFPQMWRYFEKADVLIGYNSEHFDIPILDKYYRGDLTKIKSLDLMAEIKKKLGRRIGLQAIAEATLGKGKSGHGLDAIYWWKNKEIDKLRKYCIEDVKVTKELFDYIVVNKKVKYKDGPNIREVEVDTSNWNETIDSGVTTSLF